MVSEIYNINVDTIKGEATTLEPYKGKVMLIVNTASKCGFTPQYEGLEKLHKDYAHKGLAVLGFPCNQFGSQEPGNEQKIEEFCTLNFGVTFPMFKKIDVNGKDAHPLYKFLKSQQKGVLGTSGIKWNFTKFLVGKDGEVIERYGSTAKPEDIAKDIEKLLAA